MADRFLSTGRKSKSDRTDCDGLDRFTCRGALSATINHAIAALALAPRNAARQPKAPATRPAQANDSAPEIPMLAAWPAVARDMSFSSTLSARSFKPVI